MLLLGFMLTPFVAVNFYYSLNAFSCQDTRIVNYPIVFTLKRWLYVDSFTILILFSISAVSAILAAWKLTDRTPYIIYTASVSVLGFWRGIWLIIGGIMFWGDLNKRGVCSQSLSIYMWCNLIIGYASLPFYYIFGSCYAKVKPVPVQVLDFRQPTERNFYW